MLAYCRWFWKTKQQLSGSPWLLVSLQSYFFLMTMEQLTANIFISSSFFAAVAIFKQKVCFYCPFPLLLHFCVSSCAVKTLPNKAFHFFPIDFILPGEINEEAQLGGRDREKRQRLQPWQGSMMNGQTWLENTSTWKHFQNPFNQVMK